MGKQRRRQGVDGQITAGRGCLVANVSRKRRKGQEGKGGGSKAIEKRKKGKGWKDGVELMGRGRLLEASKSPVGALGK